MSDQQQRIRVWDWPIRVFHWLIAGLIPFAWWTYKTDRMQWHRYAGYAVLALLVFRLFWGFFGSDTARFANFIRGPRGIWRYVTGRAKSVIGHNPLGAWSVVALLALMSVQASLGLFAADDEGIDSGPLAARISFETAQRAEHWHEILFYALLALIGLHLTAILFYAARGDNLVAPMIRGSKLVATNVQSPKRGSVLLAVIGILLAGAVFAAFVWVDNS